MRSQVLPSVDSERAVRSVLGILAITRTRRPVPSPFVVTVSFNPEPNPVAACHARPSAEVSSVFAP